jgi:HlyD family secretion protein
MRLLKLTEETLTPPAGPPIVHHRLGPWTVALLAGLSVIVVGTAVDHWWHTRPVPAPLVFLAPVTRGPVAAQLRLTGTLEPIESRTVAQPAPGRATEVLVRVGETVVAGQVVARFDPMVQRAELARAESRVVAAEADAFRAELLLLRLQQQLPETGEDADDALSMAQVRLATASAELDARTAAYRVARRQLGDRVVRAPLAGVVMSRKVEPGDTVGAGAALLVIGSSPRRLRVVGEAPEAALAGVKAGQPATFTVPAFPGRVFEARVSHAGSLTGPVGARRFPVVLDVNNQTGALAFGMTAAVEIDTRQAGPVFRVPLAALSFSPASYSDSGGQAIWLGDPRGGALMRTAVEVGATDGVHAEVRGSGLAEGAMVAVGAGRRGGR